MYLLLNDLFSAPSICVPSCCCWNIFVRCLSPKDHESARALERLLHQDESQMGSLLIGRILGAWQGLGKSTEAWELVCAAHKFRVQILWRYCHPPTSYLKASLPSPSSGMGIAVFHLKKRKSELLVHWFQMTLGFTNQKQKNRLSCLVLLKSPEFGDNVIISWGLSHDFWNPGLGNRFQQNSCTQVN